MKSSGLFVLAGFGFLSVACAATDLSSVGQAATAETAGVPSSDEAVTGGGLGDADKGRAQGNERPAFFVADLVAVGKRSDGNPVPPAHRLVAFGGPPQKDLDGARTGGELACHIHPAAPLPPVRRHGDEGGEEGPSDDRGPEAHGDDAAPMPEARGEGPRVTGPVGNDELRDAPKDPLRDFIFEFTSHQQHIEGALFALQLGFVPAPNVGREPPRPAVQEGRDGERLPLVIDCFAPVGADLMPPKELVEQLLQAPHKEGSVVQLSIARIDLPAQKPGVGPGQDGPKSEGAGPNRGPADKAEPRGGERRPPVGRGVFTILRK